MARTVHKLKIAGNVFAPFSQVKFAYKEPAYKEVPVIKNGYLFPNLYQGTSSLYVTMELRL